MIPEERSLRSLDDPTVEIQKGIETKKTDSAAPTVKTHDPTVEIQKGIETQ